MAGETLLTLAGVLAGLPDNASQLINPVDVRNVVIAVGNDVGIATEETTYSLSITDGVPVSVLAGMPAPSFIGIHWDLDGNNRFVPDWGTVTIPPGLERLAVVRSELLLEKLASGDDEYIANITVGGVNVHHPFEIYVAGTDPQSFSIQAPILYDHSTGLPIDITIEGNGTGDDLNVIEIDAGVLGWQI